MGLKSLFAFDNKGAMSRFVVLATSVLWVLVYFNTNAWRREVIEQDIISYYGYLPVTFIHHDWTIDHIEDPEGTLRIWKHETDNGGSAFKMSMGLSMAYCPFFLVGHIVAQVLGYAATGYSLPYKVALMWGTGIYLIFGLWSLRMVLIRFYSDQVSAIVLSLIVLGTNLYWYAFYEFLMPHTYLFALVSVFISLCLRLADRPSIGVTLYIGLIFGWLMLIRPTSVILILFPIGLLFRSRSLEGILSELWRFRLHLLIIGLSAFLVWVPQLVFWKINTGQWWYYSYGNEGFFLLDPHLVDFLFGFRKGWFIYTPIMLLSAVGLYFLFQNDRRLFIAVSGPVVCAVWVLSSWWCWWYGGSFGMRVMIDYYPLMAIPMASLTDVVIRRKARLRVLMAIIGIALVGLNLFQTIQYSKGDIHHDSMTADAYRIGFARLLNKPLEWYGALSAPEYGRALKGLPEALSDTEWKDLDGKRVVLISRYQKLLCPDSDSSAMLRAACVGEGDLLRSYFNVHMSDDSLFRFETMSGEWVVLDTSGMLRIERISVHDATVFMTIRNTGNRFVLRDQEGGTVGFDRHEPYKAGRVDSFADPDSLFIMRQIE